MHHELPPLGYMLFAPPASTIIFPPTTRTANKNNHTVANRTPKENECARCLEHGSEEGTGSSKEESSTDLAGTGDLASILKDNLLLCGELLGGDVEAWDSGSHLGSWDEALLRMLEFAAEKRMY
jgi:hypothetical protein